MWIVGNEGFLKLFKCGVVCLCLILKYVNFNKGLIDIVVMVIGDLIYGIKLKNIVFRLIKDKVEELINFYDWKFLSLCIIVFGEFLVCMMGERKYRCRVVCFN